MYIIRLFSKQDARRAFTLCVDITDMRFTFYRNDLNIMGNDRESIKQQSYKISVSPSKKLTVGYVHVCLTLDCSAIIGRYLRNHFGLHHRVGWLNNPV